MFGSYSLLPQNIICTFEVKDAAGLGGCLIKIMNYISFVRMP